MEVALILLLKDTPTACNMVRFISRRRSWMFTNLFLYGHTYALTTLKHTRKIAEMGIRMFAFNAIIAKNIFLATICTASQL